MIKPQAGARFKFRERLENHSVITVRNRIPIVEYCDAYKIDDIDPETGASPIILYKGCDRYGYEELRTFHHTIDIEKGWEITEEHHSPWQDSRNIFINLFANKTIDYTNSLEHAYLKEEKVLKDEEAFLLFFDREKKLIMRVTLNNFGNIFVSMKDYAIYINDTEESIWKTDYFYDYSDGEEWNKYIKYFDYTPLVVEPLKVEPLIFTKNTNGGEHLIEPPQQEQPSQEWLETKHIITPALIKKEVKPILDKYGIKLYDNWSQHDDKEIDFIFIFSDGNIHAYTKEETAFLLESNNYQSVSYEEFCIGTFKEDYEVRINEEDVDFYTDAFKEVVCELLHEPINEKIWYDQPIDIPVINTDKLLTETLTFKQFNELVFDNNLEYTLENGVYTTRKGDITYITKVNNNE